MVQNPLSPNQQELLRKLVAAAERSGRQEIQFFNNSKHQLVVVNGGTENIPATPADLQDLAGYGFIRLTAVTFAQYGGSITQAAFNAVKTDFGVTKRDRFLKALHDLTVTAYRMPHSDRLLKRRD